MIRTQDRCLRKKRSKQCGPKRCSTVTFRNIRRSTDFADCRLGDVRFNEHSADDFHSTHYPCSISLAIFRAITLAGKFPQRIHLGTRFRAPIDRPLGPVQWIGITIPNHLLATSLAYGNRLWSEPASLPPQKFHQPKIYTLARNRGWLERDEEAEPDLEPIDEGSAD